VLLLPSTVLAQAGGSISGLVTDTTGGILPGVTVEAASPVLIEGKLSAITDTAGRYTIVQLRPGTYTVTFTLAGFQTLVREGLVLTGDAALQVNAQLPVGQLEQSVTVTGQSPLVDVQQVRGQFVTTRDMMDVLPGANTFAGRALLIPGVANQGMSDGQYWPAAHGNTWRDAQTANDGMRANVIIDDGQWQMGWEMNQAATAELSYELSGAPAEIQGGGVVQNAIPKEGGNRFAGTFFTSFSNESLAASNADPTLLKQLGAVNRNAYDYDINPGFGGPIMKDKLWFFGAFRRRERKVWQGGSFFTGEGTPDQRAANGFPTAGSQGYIQEWANSGLMRITHSLSSKHKYRLGFERIGTKYPLVDTDNTRPPESADRIPQPVGYHTQLRWTSTLTNKLLLEAGLAVQYNKWRREQFEWNAGQKSSYDNLINSNWQGAFWITGWQPEKSRNAKASVSYVTGSHNFKTGFEDRWGNVGLDQGPIAGDVRTYFYYNVLGNYNPLTNTGMSVPGCQVCAAPVGVMVLGTPVGSFSADINHDLGIYAQDKWTVGKWTLNLGVRADFFRSSIPPQSAPAGAWVPARSFSEFAGADWKTVVPRMGVAYDLFGNGKTALKAAAYKYVNSESTTLAMAANPMSSYTWSAKQDFRTWNDLDHNGSVIGPNGQIQYNEVGPPSDKNFGTAAAGAQINVGNRPGQWEFNTVIQHELLQGLSIGGGWYRRNYFDYYIYDNTAQSYSDYTQYSIKAPNDPRLGTYANSTLPIYNLNPALFGQVTNTYRNAPNNLRERLYDGFELLANGRRQKLFFGASANYERTHDGNCDQDNPNLNLYCTGPFVWLWQFKGHVAYTLPWDILASAFVQGYPGPAQIAYYNITSAIAGIPLTNNQIAANNTWNILPPNAYFLPYQRKLDLRFSRPFTVGRTKLRPDVDVFNVFNANTTTTVNSTCCGAAYMTPLTIMQARFVRFGLQVDF